MISAAHAGSEETTPAGAKAFGRRQDDPSVGGNFNDQDDKNSLKITFALVRTLSSLGFIPYTVINLVSRRYMDLNRTWGGQQMWQDTRGTYRPGDENKTLQQFPRLEEFKRFRKSFYQDFHDTLQQFTTSQHPHGWLFDIHGTSLEFLGTNSTLEIVTTGGFTARRDIVYDKPHNLHRYLVDGGFSVFPITADPGAESPDFGRATGTASLNLISGGRYGAQPPPANLADLPERNPVIPGPQSHRVHGVQFEIDKSLRWDQTDEQLESTGINIANAIYRCLLGNQVLQRQPQPRDGENAVLCYSMLT
jgi:hypothetical protein